VSDVWEHSIRLAEAGRGPLKIHLEPEATIRAAIAKKLGLESLPRLTADLTITSWLDGAEILGRFDAVVEQVCGVSLDPFEQPLTGNIDVRLVPAGSPNTPADPLGEVVVDEDTPDPPDVLEGEVIDLAGYIIEHLALEIDPFPRKPGAAFDYQPPAPEDSPFAVLKALKANDD
jgi:uncharacterized metal-binding protein YceD (DUF177 family)